MHCLLWRPKSSERQHHRKRLATNAKISATLTEFMPSRYFGVRGNKRKTEKGCFDVFLDGEGAVG